MQEIKTIIEGFGLPVAYYQFQGKTQQGPPMVSWYFTGRDDLYADDRNYLPIAHLVIELYTAYKDHYREGQIERKLEGLDLPYGKEETYIDTERMYMTTYDMDVILTPEDDDKEGAPHA